MSNPLFSYQSNIGMVRTVSANTASDGSGVIDTLFTASGTTGSRVDMILFRNSQTTAALSTACVFRVFITDTDGANPRLLDEVAMPAATRSTSVIGSAVSIVFPGGLYMKAGQQLKVCQSVWNAATQCDIIAKGSEVA